MRQATLRRPRRNATDELQSIPGIGPSRKALYMKSWVKRRHTEIKGIPGISPQSCLCAS